ncbi:MAG: hypothetical protein QOI66_699, partial [Myxococcales bacterium]|nr:hypothetical protein [Myxococcales bacterium]
LVQFDSAVLKAAVGPQDLVVSARLEMTLTNNRLRTYSRQVGAFRLTTGWAELGATWNCPTDTDLNNHRPDCATDWSMGLFNPPNPWVSPATSTITVPATQVGSVAFDVTADVLAFVKGTAVNSGWMLRGSTPGEFAEFASRESGTPPRLVLTIQRCSASLCDDGNACTVDSCDATAHCTNTAVINGSTCSDGNACTQTDSCQDGACTGQSPVVCLAADQCHQAGTCDQQSGACDSPQLPTGSACGDGNVCDDGGSCVQCLAASSCPGVDSVCGARTCTAGACGVAFAPAGTLCGTGLACDGAGACAGIPQVVINEVESNGGVPGDWVELFNAGTAVADLSAWIFRDSDDTHAYRLPAGTTLAPGAYLVLEEAQFVFGLGAGDAARIFDARGVLIDSYVWTAHAAVTYGRCPNGTGALGPTTISTKGAANNCTVPMASIKINEVESNNGVPGDWVELFNAGTAAADLSSWIFRDSDDTHAYVLPGGTTLAPGAYLVLEEAQFVFGLGAGDAARIYDAQGVLIDSYVWTAHAAVTYGRCPNGTGPLGPTTAATKGAANDCGATTPPVALPWPGANKVATVDGVNVFGGNLSDLFYEPGSAQTVATLWAVRNGPSLLHRLLWNGAIWAPDTSDGWTTGKTLLYPNGGGSPDAEGVTRAELSSSAIYVATERDNDVGGVSRLSILRYDVGQPGTELTATHEWNLNGDLPISGSNLGLEALTWVPDSYLLANGFVDESAGRAYDPAQYPEHGTGLFFVGLESNGVIYAYALNHATGAFTRVATIASGNPGVMSVSFDRDTGYLWAHCDDTCGNVVGVLSIDTTGAPATKGKFKLLRQLARPSSMANLNNEGIALQSEAECVGGFKGYYWTDDSDTDGHALRFDSVPCGRFLP